MKLELFEDGKSVWSKMYNTPTPTPTPPPTPTPTPGPVPVPSPRVVSERKQILTS